MFDPRIEHDDDAATSNASSCSIFGSPYLSKSCSLATPSIPMIFLLPLLATTRLGFDGSVMKKHWSTWEPSTHGSFFAVTFAPAVLDLASGITMVVKYRSSFRTLLAHLEQIESYAPGRQVRFGSLNYTADIRGDLILDGFEPQPSVRTNSIGHLEQIDSYA